MLNLWMPSLLFGFIAALNTKLQGENELLNKMHHTLGFFSVPAGIMRITIQRRQC